MTSTEWNIYGLAGVWELVPAVSTSTGSPVVVTAGQRLISPTGFRTAATVVRY